jgi:hypothetical protein
MICIDEHHREPPVRLYTLAPGASNITFITTLSLGDQLGQNGKAGESFSSSVTGVVSDKPKGTVQELWRWSGMHYRGGPECFGRAMYNLR